MANSAASADISYLLKDLLRAFRTARGEVRDPAECGTTLYNKLLPVAKFW